MAAVSSILAIGSIATQAYGTYSQGEAQKDAMEYNAMVAEYDIQRQEEHKEHELHKEKTRQRRLLAKQVNAAAASGRSFSGSPLDVIARSESDSLINQSIILSNVKAAKGRIYSQAASDKAYGSIARNTSRQKMFNDALYMSGQASRGYFGKASAQNQMNKKRKSEGF